MDIDYSAWKLNLPVDATGGTLGGSLTIGKIDKNYQCVPYFRQLENSIIFHVPTDGATTSGSNYPRSELREMINGKEAAWKVDKTSTLEATVRIVELPKTVDGKLGKLVIGQIHGPSDELCRLYYDNGKVYFKDDKAGTDYKETTFKIDVPNIELLKWFSYKIQVRNKKLSVSITHSNGTTVTKSETISSFWTGKSMYFKAGVYLQVGKIGSKASTQGTGFGIAEFSKIKVSHGIL